ncbi:hypothetical protein Tco_1057431 [Tanacetum coccineum]|uniref:Uncharacterized protein n=1 Tax=Tanacetum coccineum TaxID=301880 RepID=A0ABQ5H641_9ASTR
MESDKDDQSYVGDDDNEIKLEDLSEMVKDIGVEAMDLDSLKDDQPRLISSKDEADIQSESHAESEDTSALQRPPSPKCIQIQDLTNQVLLLQSQNFKLEKAQAAHEAETALLKAQPSFPNVQQLTELLVNSLKPELSKLLRDHDFNTYIPTELKELPSKFTKINRALGDLKQYMKKLEIKVPCDLKVLLGKLEEFQSSISVLISKVVAFENIKLDILAGLLALLEQVSSVNAQLSKLNVLDTLPSLLNRVAKALDRFLTVVDSASQQVGDNSVPLAGDKVKYDKYRLMMLNRRDQGNIINCDVLSRGKGPITLKVYRDDGLEEIIKNFKASDLHLVELELDLSKPLEDQDPILKLNLLAKKKRKNADDLHDYFKSTQSLCGVSETKDKALAKASVQLGWQCQDE